MGRSTRCECRLGQAPTGGLTQRSSIQSDELLVGDIVHVEAGSILSCDGVIVSMSADLKVDESDATGESDAISKTVWGNKESKDGDEGDVKKGSDEDQEKDEEDPILLSGSKILEGEGRYLVLAVGPSSFQGKIFMSLRSSQPDQTRMQKQLADLAEKIAKLASIAGGLLFLCLFIRNCVELRTKPDRTPAEKGQGFIQSFVIAVTLIVVAVPEGRRTSTKYSKVMLTTTTSGLPLAVTLALAFATNRMTSHNLLVRVFEACETMSNANVIVTDKTGTLTANQMRVVEGTIGGTAFSLRDKQGNAQEDGNSENDDEGEIAEESEDGEVKDTKALIELLKKNEKLFEILSQSVAVNSSAFEEHTEAERKGESVNKKDKSKGGKKGQQNGHSTSSKGDEAENDGPRFVGNKTDSALLQMMEVTLKDIKKQSYAEIREEAETVVMFPFNSDRKAMATAIKLKDGKGYRLFVKGAAEVIVGLCTSRAKLEGESGDLTEDIDEKYQKHIQSLVEKYAKRSLRTIAMAYRDVEEWPPSEAGQGEDGKVSYDDVAKELTLLSIPAIEDPLREGVVDAVKKCHIAGVSVKMCTGDNVLTAKWVTRSSDRVGLTAGLQGHRTAMWDLP